MNRSSEIEKLPYCRFRIFLHWLSAVIILWVLPSGFYMAIFEVPDFYRERIGLFNILVGTLLIPFFAIRILVCIACLRNDWRGLVSPQAWLVFVMHKLIYLVTAVVLATGVLMLEQPTDVFGLFVMPVLLQGSEAIALFNQAHRLSCVALALLVFLHVAAVIRHELFGRPILWRMRW